MEYKLNKHLHAERWLFLFISIHLIGWTLVPALVRYNLPLDAIEGTTWGHQLQWGYDKNPFLNGWLTALAGFLGGPSGWMIYLFSQISVVVCFWAIWRVAKNMLHPAYALISVMLLEGAQYYNFHAIDFNDNTLELGLWGLSIYFFYKALRSSNHYRAWFLTGLLAGLAFMAKYYTAVLLASMTLFLFLRAENRKQLITPAPYVGLVTFLIVILPHLVWLFFHDFITVTYVFQRTSSPPSWTNHFFFPLQFTWQQGQVLLPVLALFALLLMGKKPILAQEKTELTSFDKAFLFYIGLGPFLLTILLALLFGIRLRAGWGMPLWSLGGVILVAMLQPHLTKSKFYRFIAAIFIMIGAMLSAYSLSLIDSPDPSSANFPGREIAETVTNAWREKYHTPLAYVGGSRWVGGNIGFYSSDHPAVFIEWNKKRAPWINIADMKKQGAVFVWEISAGETLQDSVRKQFPQLLENQIMTFSWLRNRYDLSPIKIGVAILPPAESR
ncbi:glycosyltransferase family 39 protein [Aquicella lusitana]|uniref:Dolichyl-phosphate-mannose-protein mannosyltransferase n=1 Tax=Aquicella lusitana TaxID=254246 RepID=A0A370GTT7_9COXI|nr:glycosyltransferase family 39 protein [Aquicella lusitana]RDI46889.1 dolichyl-phosphate-mannose-protein mannosyltransferase [Aquicella lusitana]VVC73780.1 hypothetical protein AQULUS_15290 [Aquicella lusitana]